MFGVVDAFVIPSYPLTLCYPLGCSSRRPLFRDERVAHYDKDSSLGIGSSFAACAAPLVTRRA